MLSGPRKPQRVAVFISGGGSTLQALLEMQHQIDIVLVVSNRKKAPGLLKARRFGKPTLHLSKEMSFPDLTEVLKQHAIEKIVLAGFMKILPPEFVGVWAGRIVNIHPSLLPDYPGLEGAEKCWNDDFTMGVSLHDVIAEMDAGKVFLRQAALPSPKKFGWPEASLFLRRTEQFLLREMTSRLF